MKEFSFARVRLNMAYSAIFHYSSNVEMEVLLRSVWALALDVSVMVFGMWKP